MDLHSRRRSGLLRLALTSALLLLASASAATTFQATYRASTYQVTSGDSYASLLAQHQSGALIASVPKTSFENMEPATDAGVVADYSVLFTVDFTSAVSGQYLFQAGADWGRGAVAAVIESGTSVIDEFVTTDDVWWNYDFGNPDVISRTVNLTAGNSYTLAWLGFEDCCSGPTSMRFSFEGGAFQALDETNFSAYAAPEPGSGALVALGLALLASRSVRRR
jgi:MYXO-CTERM domain-containing protein